MTAEFPSAGTGPGWNENFPSGPVLFYVPYVGDRNAESMTFSLGFQEKRVAF